MIQYTLNLLDKIKFEIETIDLEEDTILNKSVKIIDLLKTYFDELKEHISDYTFNNETDEIQFFKETKPQIFCMLIFYDNIYKLEINRPTGSESMQKAFTLKQFDALKEYFDNNIDFYKYCRSHRTDLDQQYFLRYQSDVEIYFDSQYFERDQKFSTGFDLKVATILANDMMSNYLNAELAKEDVPNALQFDNTNTQKVKAKWTGSKVALIELIYAFDTAKCINNGKSDLKKMTSYVENLFDIDLGDVYRTFIEIRGRKGSRVQCLDDFRKKLIERMDEADCA
jgi:hypothetical protein